MPDATIFIANSDVALLNLLGTLLTDAGFETIVTLTDPTTYTHIKQVQPSLVILDVGIQAAAGGWPLLKRLHLDPQTMHIPVLVTTVDHAFIEDKQEFLQARGYDALELPMSFEELLAKVKSMRQRG